MSPMGRYSKPPLEVVVVTLIFPRLRNSSESVSFRRWREQPAPDEGEYEHSTVHRFVSIRRRASPDEATKEREEFATWRTVLRVVLFYGGRRLSGGGVMFYRKVLSWSMIGLVSTG